MLDSIRYYTSSYTLSELLYNYIGTIVQCIVYAKSKATMYPSTRPCNPLPSSPSDYLPIDRSAVDEHKLVYPVLNSNIFSKEEE